MQIIVTDHAIQRYRTRFDADAMASEEDIVQDVVRCFEESRIAKTHEHKFMHSSAKLYVNEAKQMQLVVEHDRGKRRVVTVMRVEKESREPRQET